MLISLEWVDIQKKLSFLQYRYTKENLILAT